MRAQTAGRFHWLLLWIAIGVAMPVLTTRASTSGDAQKTVESLIADLTGGDLQTRREAAWDLATFGAEAAPAVAALATAIGDDDPQVSNGALQALGDIGPAAAEAIPQIAERLRRGDGQRRYRAAYALGHVAPPDHPSIAAGLSDDDARVRAAMVEAVGWMGARAAILVDKLAIVLADQDPDVGEKATATLAQIGAPAVPRLTACLKVLESPIPSEQRRQRRAAEALGRMGQVAEPSAAALQAQAKATRDADLRAAVITALARVAPNDAKSVACFHDGLAATEPAVQTAAISSLLRNRAAAEAAIPQLIALLDSDAEVANVAAFALGRIGAAVRPAIPQLVGRMNADNELTIVNTISRLGPEAIPPLLDAAEQQIITPSQAAEIIGNIGLQSEAQLAVALQSPRASDRLTACLGFGQLKAGAKQIAPLLADADMRVRAGAAMALANFGPAAGFATDQLLAALASDDTQVRVECLTALVAAQAPADRVVEPLLEHLRHESAEVRQRSVATLAALSDVPVTVIEALAVALQDPEESVRRESAATLAKFGKSAGPAAGALIAATRDPSSTVVQAAAAALAAIEPVEQPTIAALTQLMEHQELEIRRAAVAALGRAGAPAQAAQMQLEALLQDSAAEIRMAAIAALANILPDPAVRVSMLARGLDDSDWTVRRGSIELLAGMEEQAVSAVPRLLQLWSEGEEAETVSAALRRIDAAPPEAVPMLLEILRDRDDRRRRFYALHLLRKLGPAAKDALPVLRELRESSEGRIKEFLDRAIDEIEG